MRISTFALGLLWSACSDGKDTLTVTDTETDTDTDTDADTDTDTDADTDTATETGTETDTGTETGERAFIFDEDHVLVIPDGTGLHLLANDGSFAFSRTWDDLIGNCALCGGEGASVDGDGLLVAFTTAGPLGAGAIARIDSTGALDFRVDGFSFPHDAVRDPADNSILISETLAQRLTWIDGSGLSAAPIRTLSDDDSPDWPGLTPNGNSLFTYDGRNYLLVSHRGAGGFDASGAITLWDITTPGDPLFLWRFPETGDLDTPHGCIVREYDGQWWLVYAHTGGAEQGGSVGLAFASTPIDPPQYVADLLPSASLAPYGFLRGVELAEDGMLYLTDSGTLGPLGTLDGRVMSAPMPAGLTPTGATGAVGDQVFVDLSGDALLADGFEQPFEGWLWVPSF